jgi:hypothetical protein
MKYQKVQKKSSKINKRFVINNISLHWIVCCLLVCTAISKVFAQNPTEVYKEETVQKRQFNRAQWRETTNGLDYFSKEKPKKTTSKESRVDGYEGGGGRSDSRSSGRVQPPADSAWSLGPSLGKAFTAFIIIIGIIIIIMILLYLFKEGISPSNPKVKALGETVSLEDIEENLNAHDPSDLIQQATLAGNYKLAIRLYYLKTLRELSLVGKIVWKKDKTNREYAYELKASPLQSNFQEATLIFERIWYGDLPITQSEFTQVQPTFEELLQKITKIIKPS